MNGQTSEVWFVFVIVLLTSKYTTGQQTNCIDPVDTRLTVVATRSIVIVGGTTDVQCQVSPASKNFCDFRMTIGGPPGEYAFDKSNCPSGTISDPRYTGQCDVTNGRYGLRIENIQMTDAGRWSCNYMNSFPNSKTVVTVLAPPSGPVLTSQPAPVINNIVTVQENSQLTVTCDGSQSGATGLKYKWTGVNPSGQSGNKLRFQPVRRTDSGVYTCNVSNTVGSVADSITINVTYPPSGVTLQGPESPVQESATVVFTCTATGGYPIPTLAITRTPGGSAVKQGVGRQLMYSTSVSKTDNQAEYQCTATGAGISVSVISNKVTLTVYFQAAALTLMKSPVDHVFVNNNQQIECKTDSSNPAVQIHWFTYSSKTWTQLISQPATSQTNAVYHGFSATSILSITATKPMNQARYRCETGNLSKDTTITIHFPPESITLTEIPNGSVVQGTSKTLTCTTDSSNPVSTIVWAFSSVATTWTNMSPNPATNHKPGPHSGHISTSSLVVSTDKDKNGRQYKCTAYQNGKPGVSKSITLSILYAADSVSLTPVKSVITENNSIRLNCAATGGNPDSYIYTWKFSTLPAAVWKTIGSTNDYLTLENLSKADSGRYRCEATNTAGFTISNIATVHVQYSPKLSNELKFVAANIGETAKFTIKFDANPSETSLSCSHNSTNDKHEINKTSLTQFDVIIQSVQVSDYGFYSCRLKNSIGSLEILLRLTETGPPQTPSNLTVIAKTAVSVTLSWVSEFEGGFKQTFTVSYRGSDSTGFVNKSKIPDPGYRKLVQTKITALKPATDYQFKVKSINLNPADNSSSFTDIVTTKTNAIPSAINTILKQATINRDGNLVVIKLSSFPSNKYSVYVKYCITNTNQCNSTKLIEITDGLIIININIHPDRNYSYKLIVTESDDVIVSHELQLEEDTVLATTINSGLIGGVIVGISLIAIIVIVIVLLFVKRRRDGQWIWTKYRSKSSPSAQIDIDINHIVGPKGDEYATVNKKPVTRPTAAAAAAAAAADVALNEFDPYSNIDDLVSEVKKTGEPLYALVDKNKKKSRNQVVNGAGGATGPIYSTVDKSKKKKTKGSVDSAAQVDKNKKGKKTKKAEKNMNYEMDENPYQTVGEEENPYQDVNNDDDEDEDIVRNGICGVDNPEFHPDETKEPTYLHIVNNIHHQAPPSVLIGDIDDFSTYTELDRVVEPRIQAELIARLEAEEAERRRIQEELEKQKKRVH
ncbi:synaptogenesis protein syg-2-like [Tubulanus polymorphus]|uniref:synaptogenesis protein syg-2-like n=1 Tax=Tubulanus polymorphus TaxID=672921 RepID=UPI003DA3750F